MKSETQQPLKPFGRNPAPTDATPEALTSLVFAVQEDDRATAEESIRSPVISSNMDHKAIAIYLIFHKKDLYSLALSVFKGKT